MHIYTYTYIYIYTYRHIHLYTYIHIYIFIMWCINSLHNDRQMAACKEFKNDIYVIIEKFWFKNFTNKVK